MRVIYSIGYIFVAAAFFATGEAEIFPPASVTELQP